MTLLRVSVLTVLTVLMLAGALSAARAEPLRLAVAANFAGAAEELSTLFHAEHPDRERPEIVIGSSGQLVAQLVKGAPWDVFFSADMARVQALVDRDLARPGQVRVYARGRLVFWQPGAKTNSDLQTRLQIVRPVALANARLAPYGRAAAEVLERLQVDIPATDLVRGQSVGQVHAMIKTGAAPGGFVALSQMDAACIAPTCLEIPASWHGPIDQGVAVIAVSRQHELALEFFDFLATQAARDLIRRFGYHDGGQG